MFASVPVSLSDPSTPIVGAADSVPAGAATLVRLLLQGSARQASC